MTEKARIRRGGAAPRRKRPTGTPRRGDAAPRKAPPPRPKVPLPAPVLALRRWAGYAVAAILVVTFVAVLFLIKLPQMIGVEIGEAAGRAGFVVKHIETRGLKHIDQFTVNAAVDEQSSGIADADRDGKLIPMALVDLDAIRDRLMRYGWVEDARVSRRLPDTVLVDIVERVPAAIWQHRHRLMLIDAQGIVLAPVDVSAMPDLPLVIGPDANRRAGALAGLIRAAPTLKPMMAGATWVGGRRWDLRFQSGETLALPEGDKEARAALARFARLDQTARLLGQGFVRFDMRIPGKFYARVTSEPGALVPPKPAPVAPDAI